WDFAHSSPLARDHLEHAGHDLLRWTVAFRADGPAVLVLDFGPAGLELADAHEHALQDVQRLEARDHNGHPILCGERDVFFVSHYGADVTRSEERLDA